jgi:hypothetical protein
MAVQLVDQPFKDAILARNSQYKQYRGDVESIKSSTRTVSGSLIESSNEGSNPLSTVIRQYLVQLVDTMDRIGGREANECNTTG